MSAKIDYDRVQEYLHEYVPDRADPFLEMEAYAEEVGFPIIGPLAGHFCYMLARMVNAKRVFELGSGYGYSTAWFAKAVDENGGGEVHHVVWDEDLSDRAEGYLTRLGYAGMMRYHVREAIDTLREMDMEFDLMFSDINKDAYPDSLPVIYEKLKNGGVLIVDNLIWGGRVMDPKNQDQATVAIRKFAQAIAEDPRWIQSTVPLRDGLLVAYKR